MLSNKSLTLRGKPSAANFIMRLIFKHLEQQLEVQTAPKVSFCKEIVITFEWSGAGLMSLSAEFAASVCSAAI